METHRAARLGAGSESPTEKRYRMIAEAAYYRAVKRGFTGGNPVSNWLDAHGVFSVLLRSSEYPHAYC